MAKLLVNDLPDEPPCLSTDLRDWTVGANPFGLVLTRRPKQVFKNHLAQRKNRKSANVFWTFSRESNVGFHRYRTISLVNPSKSISSHWFSTCLNWLQGLLESTRFPLMIYFAPLFPKRGLSVMARSSWNTKWLLGPVENREVPGISILAGMPAWATQSPKEVKLLLFFGRYCPSLKTSIHAGYLWFTRRFNHCEWIRNDE